MRHLILPFAFVGILAVPAVAAPFEPATIPDTALAVGHVDIDLARKTNLYAAVDAAGLTKPHGLDGMPPELAALVPQLTKALRGVSFWRGPEFGALYIETNDARLIAQVIAKLPASGMPITASKTVDGAPTWSFKGHDKDGYLATVGATVILANSPETLEQSIKALDGHGGNLAGSRKLTSPLRSGVFVFVTVGNDLIDEMQKSSHAKIMQLPMKSIAFDVSESGTTMIGNLHAEMANPDAVAKATSIVNGIIALGSLSDDDDAKALLKGVTVTTSGNNVDVVAKLPEAQLTKLLVEAHAHEGEVHEHLREHFGK
ncbi:MAG TPA: hypothetical protein VGM88_11810 [Kofleriaceae bacterium]